MKKRTMRVLSLAVCGLLAASSAATAADDLWLHVRVDEAQGAKVSVNLPLSMVEKALPMIPTEHMHDAHLEFDDWQVSAADLRELWREIQNSPDMAFVNVEDQGEHVKVWKQGDYLRVTVDGRGASGEQVEVRIPLTVVDALLSTDGEEMNFQAAIAALVDHGEGELVTVTDNEDKVRVWVDRIAEAD